MLDIRARTALVTGASAGVGLAVARRLLQFGANVALCARDTERLAAAAAALNAPQRVLALPWDVADTARAPEILERVIERFGALSILVNNAAVNHRGDFVSLRAQEVASVIDTNLRAPMILTRLALPMIQAAGQGAIVNVASLAGRVPLPHEACYSASKFGLRAFTLALAQELAGSAVSASVVSPGPIDTGFIMDAIDEVPDMVFSQPVSSAEEVAEAVLQCIRDGRAERALPFASGLLCHLAYLFPGLARRMRPALEARGRRTKALYRSRQRVS